MKAVYPVPDRCINCHLCEIACIVEHSATKDPVSAYFAEGLRFNSESVADYSDPADAVRAGRQPPLNRCRVWTDDCEFISTMCRHCETAECVLACKNGALYTSDDGTVLLDEDKCVGCWMCIMACPFGAISRNVERHNVPGIPGNGINLHCDLCPRRQPPACVYVCPTAALVFEDRDGA